jgi:hypothetical protein
MLTRSTQVGEFYVMRPPPFPPKPGTRPGFLDILVYDEESDRHIRVKWVDAYIATCAALLVKTNTIRDTEMTKQDGTPYTFGQWNEHAADLMALNEEPEGVPTEPTAYTKFCTEYKKYTECMMVVCRPFIEHLMHSAVVMVAGRETGATLFGPADMRTPHR